MADSLVKIIHTFNINNIFKTNPIYQDNINEWKTYNPNFEVMVHTESEQDFIDFKNQCPVDGIEVDSTLMRSYIALCYLYKYGGFFIEANMQIKSKLEDYYTTTTLPISNNKLYIDILVYPIYSKLQDNFVLDLINSYKSISLPINYPIVLDWSDYQQAVDMKSTNDLRQTTFDITIYNKLDINYDFLIFHKLLYINGVSYKKLYISYRPLSSNTKYINNKDALIVALNAEQNSIVSSRAYTFSKKEDIDTYIKYLFYYCNLDHLIDNNLVEFDINN